MKFSRMVIGGLLLCLSSMLFAQRSFLVAPTHLNVDLNRRTIQTLIVSNTGEDRIHVKIKPLFLPVASRSLGLGQPLHPEQEKDYNLSSFIRVSPRALSLSPGEEREVRLSINPPHRLTNGAYRSHVLFHMVEARERPHSEKEQAAAKKANVDLNMMMEMAISVYGTKGKGGANLLFQCHRSKQGRLAISATNDSAWRFIGTLNVTSLQKHKKEKPVDLILLRDSKRQLHTNIAAKSSQYLLQWQADSPYQGKGQVICNLS